MEVEKLSSCPNMNLSEPLKVKTMGNIIEVQYMSHRNNKQTVQMLKGGKQYVVCSTGEIVDIKKKETRQENRKGLLKTFALCRDLINTNVTDVSKVRWITLTYKENMTDTKKLYKDFEKFNKRFQYFCKKNNYGKPEYIVMMEPQGRGAWHAHLLYIWEDRKAPFIENKVLADLWGHGFVKIKKLDNVDNVGAYLTAYLGDMEYSETIEADIWVNNDFKKVEVEEDGKKVKKMILKGARLKLYPANFNMIRHSRGIKKPVVEFVEHSEIKEKISGATLTFEKTLRLKDVSTNFECIINTKYYNMLR